MLSQVLKKMKAIEKKSGDIPDSTNKQYPTSKLRAGSGFHAKENSLKGAERQRSIGNRNNKPSR